MDFEQKVIEVRGKEYTLQKLPLRKAMEIRQKWILSNGGYDDIAMCDECFKHIVVSPKVKLDDFTSLTEVEEIVTKALEFQYEGE